jgi:hypothetical protein
MIRADTWDNLREMDLGECERIRDIARTRPF